MNSARTKRRVPPALLAVLVIATAFSPIAPAAASQDVIPSEAPIWDMPRIMDGRVLAIESSGDTVVVGGSFETIRQAPVGANPILQPNLFSFNSRTGDINNNFRPQIDGPVNGVAIAADGASVYVGGEFGTVNGTSRANLVRLSLTDGSIIGSWSATTNGTVEDIQLAGDQLIVAGRFSRANTTSRQRLASLNAATGAVRTDFNISITDPRAFSTYVNEIDVSADGRWLVIVGGFMKVDGRDRNQLAVIELTPNGAMLANWSTERYASLCSVPTTQTYMRDIDIAPDSSYFVVVTTGAFVDGIPELCDTAARWELPPSTTGEYQQPTWVSYTGGDTSWAVEVTEAAVYVGGHQRWWNNPFAQRDGVIREDDGPGTIPRPGIVALDTYSGLPLSWNPTRDRGRGVEAFHATDDHLFVGSDTTIFNGTTRQRLAVLPAQPAYGTNLDPQTIELPVELNAMLTNGNMAKVSFDGTRFANPGTVSGPGVDGISWASTRGAFWQHGTLVYFGASGAYYERHFSTSAPGSATSLSATVGYLDDEEDITPYDQPFNVDLTRTAAYHDGRIYYTRTGDTRLWSRAYSLESGVIGSQEFVSSYGAWGGARGITIIDGWLYAAWSDGSLYRMPFTGPRQVDRSQRQLVDNGSSGINWATVRGLFARPVVGASSPPAAVNPLSCQGATPWKAEYFEGPYSGANDGYEAVSIRCEASLNFDYGRGAPSGVPVGDDDFSATFTRSYNLNTVGALQFDVTADDGVRIYVDGRKVLDQWRTQLADYTAVSQALSPGPHEIRVDYYERAFGAVIDVAISEVPFSAFGTAPSVSVTNPAQNGGSFPASPVRLEGTVVAGAGVEKVEATVQRLSDGLWLQDDDTFAAATNSIPTDMLSGSTTSYIGDIGVGVPALDSRGDSGYIMYSQTPVQQRFEGIRSDASQHLVVVEYDANRQSWRYDNDSVLTNFEPRSSDVLLAAIRHIKPEGVLLTGHNTSVHDIPAGFVESDLVLTKDVLAGVDDPFEFTVTGTYFRRNNGSRPINSSWSLDADLPDGIYEISPTVTAANGVVASGEPRRFTVGAVAATVDGTVNVPSTDEVLASSRPVLSGAATADLGVERVQIAIRDRDQQLWLQANGSRAAAYFAFEATLDSPRGSSTGWTFTPGFDLADGNYAVQVRARDTADTADPSAPYVRFSIASVAADTDEPDTDVTVPVERNTVFATPPAFVEGTATDDTAVTAVDVALRNRTTSEWLQDDGTFALPYNTVEAILGTPGAPTTTWSLSTATLLSGSYSLQAQAVDSSGNRDSTRPFVPFVVS